MILGPNHAYMLNHWTRAIVAARPRRALRIFEDEHRFRRYIETMHSALTEEFGVGATEQDAGAFTASYVMSLLRSRQVAIVQGPADRFIAAANEAAAAFEEGSNNFAALWARFLEATREMQAAQDSWSLVIVARPEE